MPCFGALEAGGTKMVCAVGNEDGKILERISLPTRNPENTMPEMLAFFQGKDLAGMGIGCFGPVDLDRSSPTYGSILSTPKLSWRNFPIVQRFEDALGVPVGLAVDGSASNDGSNLLEELRVAYLLHRLRSSERAPSGYDLLKIATRGGARVLGREDIGSLEAGKAGDLFLIRRDRLELVGADLDVKSMLGTVGFKGPVDATVVNGRVVVREGRLTGVDEEKEVREARTSVQAYLNR